MMDYKELAASVYYGARERAENGYTRAKARAELVYVDVRERLDGYTERFPSLGALNPIGLIALPQRLVRWLLGALLGALLIWVTFWWLDSALRDHYLGNYNAQKHIEAQKARKAAEAKADKLERELVSEREKRKVSELREAEADQRADKAMADLAAGGKSEGVIDIATINKIIREANGQ